MKHPTVRPQLSPFSKRCISCLALWLGSFCDPGAFAAGTQTITDADGDLVTIQLSGPGSMDGVAR